MALHVVPPSGIEPEPLRLQRSAQTNYARVGYECRAHAWEARTRHQIIIVIIFSCQRARQARGTRRAHLGPRCDRFTGERTIRDSRSAIRYRFAKSFVVESAEAENSKGHLVSRAALQHTDVVETSGGERTSGGTRTEIEAIRRHLADGAAQPARSLDGPRALRGGFDSIM